MDGVPGRGFDTDNSGLIDKGSDDISNVDTLINLSSEGVDARYVLLVWGLDIVTGCLRRYTLEASASRNNPSYRLTAVGRACRFKNLMGRDSTLHYRPPGNRLAPTLGLCIQGIQHVKGKFFEGQDAFSGSIIYRCYEMALVFPQGWRD